MKNSLLILFTVLAVSKGQFISGGASTAISTYPFAAALVTNLGSGAFQYACGGSVLTTTAVLSAASCFYNDDGLNDASWWQVRLGSSNVNSGGSLHQILQIIPHEDFNRLTLDNNLAVLRTSGIVLQPGVVELARIAGGAFQFQKNQRVWVVGWGSSRENLAGELHHVQTFAIDQDVCTVRYNDFGFGITDNMVCVGWLDVGVHGQCPEGGAGSSLVVDNIVVGVYSWTQGCATLRYPNINTRLSPYWRWIVSVATAPLA
ncbi:trypsin CFT-1-like [Plodia interpunctella]|uniref:trypsin CFT-1-like n=1 Tax=Plodia interpunctella TaxID=58824 RepID=UPI002367C104|nr:trypsin CFT-1-like [Plodia interpunctella]